MENVLEDETNKIDSIDLNCLKILNSFSVRICVNLNESLRNLNR